MEEPDYDELRQFYESTGHAEASEWLSHIQGSVLLGEAEIAMGLVEHAIADGIDPTDIAEGPLVASMTAVGNDFKSGEFYIPDVLMSSRALHAALFELRKHLPEDPEEDYDPRLPTILIGTVAGDLHDIGKNIASLMFQVKGYRVIDLGIDVTADRFVKAARKYRPDVIGLSALLTTTIGEMGKVIQALERAGIRDNLEVYVSGAPVTQEFADQIGADKYCADVNESLEYVKEFVLKD